MKIRPQVLVAFMVFGLIAWQALPESVEVAMACVVGMGAALAKLIESD